MESCIRLANESDFEDLRRNDKHISDEILKRKIGEKSIFVAAVNGEFAGWLRYGLFWDELPFMNMLFVLEKFRGMGLGSSLVKEWEKRMLSAGFRILLTSTQANECAQHFYRRLGYTDLGGFIPPGEGYEIILGKNMSNWERLL